MPEAFPPHISTSEARLRFNAIATSVLDAGRGDSSRRVAGHSDAGMRRDGARRVTALTLQFNWCAGNQQLAGRAAEGGET